VTPSSVSRSISSSGALLTVAALVPSGYFIGTSTADVLTSLIVSCGTRAALLVPAIIDAPFRPSQLVVCDCTEDPQICDLSITVLRRIFRRLMVEGGDGGSPPLRKILAWFVVDHIFGNPHLFG
jgi:hypothetical protein